MPDFKPLPPHSNVRFMNHTPNDNGITTKKYYNPALNQRLVTITQKHIHETIQKKKYL